MNIFDKQIKAINLVRDELSKATNTHGEMQSAHEGYAVILEEMDELWEEIKKKHQNLPMMMEEAVQVAAMAIRFIVDVIGVE